MSDNGTVDTTAQTQVTDASATGAQKLDDLPEYWQREVRSLRDECAQRRQEKTTLEAQLTQVRDDLTNREAALTKNLSDTQIEHARYRAAVDAEIPKDRRDDFASRLRGSTVEEISADANTLAQLFQAPPAQTVTPPETNAPVTPSGVDPSQGRGNRDSAPVTPAAQLREMLAGQLGRV